MLRAGAEGHRPLRGRDHGVLVTVPPQEQKTGKFSCNRCWGWERQQEEGSELGIPCSPKVKASAPFLAEKSAAGTEGGLIGEPAP